MSTFGRHLRNIEVAEGAGDHETRAFRDRYKGAHKIVTSPKYRKTKEELRTARALGAWRALNAGLLTEAAAAGVRRDYAKEFRRFAKQPELLPSK